MPVVPTRLSVGRLEILDCRLRYPPVAGGSAGRPRDLTKLVGVAVHHDAVLFEGGDRNYNGSTLDEDLQRLDAIYQRGLDMQWGGFPYHFVCSPNNRVYYTQDVRHFGAQVAHRNHELVGVAGMGLFTNVEPGDPLVCAYALGIISVYHFTGRLLDVRGHREWAVAPDPTACPGDTWWQWQRRVFERITLVGRLAFPRT